jgi:hypothetical protein
MVEFSVYGANVVSFAVRTADTQGASGGGSSEAEQRIAPRDRDIHDEPAMSDLTTYRLDQYEKRADAADARMIRVESLLTDIRVDLAKKPTVGGLWGMVATTLGIAIAMIGVFIGILTYLQAFHPSH